MFNVFFAFSERMPDLMSQILKMNQESKKKKKICRMGQEAARVGGPSQTGARSDIPLLAGTSPKRARTEEVSDLTGVDQGFTLPPCATDPRFFEKYPLMVPEDDRRRFQNMRSPALVK